MKSLNISSIKAAAVGAATGTAFGVASFLILTRHRWMGSTLFLLTPVVAGFSIALVARGRNSAMAAALVSVLGTLGILIGLGKEGPLCAAMAFPVLVCGLFLGLGIGLLARRLLGDIDQNQATTGMVLLVGPMLIFSAERIERPIIDHKRIEVVSTSISINDSPTHIWSMIQSFDSLQTTKPFLMHIGLPVPQRCTMQGHGIGAKRICYFDSGYIEETVTKWDPPYGMELRIDRTHMPGRHWLGFEDAKYSLRSDGPSTTLLRSTTFSSNLHPAWYWRPLERLGVESEHSYVLREVARKAR
jgi:hypothetical protein